jgi:general stress protein YciG
MANEGGKGSSNRGFAAMDPQKQREIASKGGEASRGVRGRGHGAGGGGR